MKYNLLSFLCAATVIAYIQRSALGVPSKRIEADLSLTSADMGLVWLAWYAGYAAFQIPSGAIVDRLGSKLALIVFAVVWSLLTGLTGFATGFTGLLCLWCAMGIAQAGIFVCATKGISVTFLQSQQAFASGALACSMAAGAALSQYVTGKLLGPLSWQEILAVYAVPGLVWAGAFAIFVPSPKAEKPQAPTPTPQLPATRKPLPWTRLFRNPHMFLLCAQQLMRAGATALFFTWFPRYLQETKNVSIADSGWLSALPLVAGMLGGLLGGVISDALLVRTQNARLSRQGVATLAMVVCAGVSLGAFYANTATSAVLLISIAAFCAYVGGVSAYATAMTMGGSRVSLVFATMNMSGNIGAGLFPFVLGKLADTTGNWNLAILLFAGLFAGSAACWAFLNPKGPLFEEPNENAN
jgi:MFS family permease